MRPSENHSTKLKELAPKDRKALGLSGKSGSTANNGEMGDHRRRNQGEDSEATKLEQIGQAVHSWMGLGNRVTQIISVHLTWGDESSARSPLA
jgi:hypothetical protein